MSYGLKEIKKNLKKERKRKKFNKSGRHEIMKAELLTEGEAFWLEKLCGSIAGILDNSTLSCPHGAPLPDHGYRMDTRSSWTRRSNRFRFDRPFTVCTTNIKWQVQRDDGTPKNPVSGQRTSNLIREILLKDSTSEIFGRVRRRVSPDLNLVSNWVFNVLSTSPWAHLHVVGMLWLMFST